MTKAKLHHYVPQFYLRRFTDRGGRLWVWDKTNDVTFRANPKSVAAENNFYKIEALADAGYDPHTMEKQFAELEANAALVTQQWLDRLIEAPLGTKIPIPDESREAVSLFLALQHLRTADTRDIIHLVAGVPMDARQKASLHAAVLWDLESVHKIRDRIKASSWVFGRNETNVPFISSDNPVAFRTADNRQWVRNGALLPGKYVVFPLSPDVVMFCYDHAHAKWERIAKFDACLSPVKFDQDMVESENSGQVFMARRFVFSPSNNFEHARDFSSSIGTDRYAQKLEN